MTTTPGTDKPPGKEPSVTDDQNIIMWILGGFAAVGSTIAAYLSGRITKTNDLGQENKVDIARLRAHMSENYSTKAETSTVKQDMQHTLDRIHTRLDEIIKAVTGGRP